MSGQSCENYRLRLAVVGDLSGWTNKSKALQDFISESNRGGQVWFVDDREKLRRRLALAERPDAQTSS